MTERMFKVVIIGDPKAGKTSFMNRCVGRSVNDDYIATIGCDFATKKIQISPTELVRLQIWDIGGQDAFRSVTRIFYRASAAAIVMFDITSRSSFEHVAEWKSDVDAKVVLADGQPIPCILLANKIDLDIRRVVSAEEIAAMSSDCKFTAWWDVSVKNNQNVQMPIRALTEQILDRCSKEQLPPSVTQFVGSKLRDQYMEVTELEESLRSDMSGSIQLHQESHHSQSCFCFY